MNRFDMFAVSATALSLCAAVSGPVSAQDASESGATYQLEEVTVTAEKREENLEKASLAVTAVTSNTLEALGVTSAADLTQVVPNLSVNQYGNGANVGIRGVVDVNQTSLGDPAVAYSLDGVYLTRQRAALTGMYDVERVEVLRGPQGTLDGRNALAGSINVITNKPDLAHDSVTASVGFGNYDAFMADGALNMPLSDTFAFRTAVDVQRHEGYVDDAPNDRRWDDQDSTAGRVHLLWQPSNNFSALLTVDVAHNGGAGGGGNASGAPWGLYMTDEGASPYKYPVQPGPQYLDQTVDGQTLTLRWSLPYLDVTYIGNHREDDFDEAISEAVLGPIATYCQTATTISGPGGACFHPLINYSDDRQMSHELRFSKDTDRWKSVLGLYYIEEYNSTIQVYEPNSATNWRLLSNPDIFEGSKAIYAQTTWSVVNSVRLTGGVRYTADAKKDDGFTQLGPFGSINNFICTGCTVSMINQGEASWSKVTWHAGVDYDLTADSLLFAAVSSGYKAGGFNTGAPPANGEYGPESLTNYELGWKNELLDHRLQVNIDAFFDKYQNYQASAGVLINGVNSSETINAGSAEIKGVELESQILLTSVDRLGFNASALETRFTNFFLPDGDGFSPKANFTPYSLTGKELPYAPHTTLRLGYEHTFELGDADNLVARADSSYVSHQWMDYHDFTDIAQDAYTRTGASLTWNHNKKFSTQLYVRNIENKAILAGVQADNNAPKRDFNDFGRQAQFMAPRTYGVKFTASF